MEKIRLDSTPVFGKSALVMNVSVFSSKSYDREYLDEANTRHGHNLTYFEAKLNEATAPLAEGFSVVAAFVNDVLNAGVLERLKAGGTRLIALRSAGFNHVDLKAAEELGLTVVRVPAYSPDGVAEHTVALTLALNRKIHRAYNRVREGNFSLEGLIGFTLRNRTVGIVGTGKIGYAVARIFNGFGCGILAYDVAPNPSCQELGMEYVTLPELFSKSDIISLHCPLTPDTRHLVNRDSIAGMKTGVMIINTSRGALVDTNAVIEGLKSGKIGHLGLDVYEEEGDLFFQNLSEEIIRDDVFMRLLTFPNVLITGHQAFLTQGALRAIAETTLASIDAFADGRLSGNEVRKSDVVT